MFCSHLTQAGDNAIINSPEIVSKCVTQSARESERVLCPECEFRGSWKSETLRHLGSAHEKVEIFLEPKYRIPK